MRLTNFDLVLPYVYKITHRDTGKFYLGYRGGNVTIGLNPIEDFGKKYFGSSSDHLFKNVEERIDEFDLQVLYVFDGKGLDFNVSIEDDYHGITECDADLEARLYEREMIKEAMDDNHNVNRAYIKCVNGHYRLAVGVSDSVRNKSLLRNGITVVVNGNEHSLYKVHTIYASVVVERYNDDWHSIVRHSGTLNSVEVIISEEVKDVGRDVLIGVMKDIASSKLFYAENDIHPSFTIKDGTGLIPPKLSKQLAVMNNISHQRKEIRERDERNARIAKRKGIKRSLKYRLSRPLVILDGVESGYFYNGYNLRKLNDAQRVEITLGREVTDKQLCDMLAWFRETKKRHDIFDNKVTISHHPTSMTLGSMPLGLPGPHPTTTYKIKQRVKKLTRERKIGAGLFQQYRLV
ncbi:hypothetical protein [Vibrio harveyi]|uniref:hypothetical protein n=1 Tax=Vibrio harveyi TaxID=669 RepID=UPI00041F87A7|nr:hypothetical protein [Vibrio harveyi]